MGDAATRSVTVTTTPAAPHHRRTGKHPAAGRAGAMNIDHAAAIAKAVTGAYLSSEGNAFSTRVASQIVQEHFNPGEEFQPAGPLFGVQFSSLACSDLIARSMASGRAPGRNARRSDCPRIPAASRCTRAAPWSAASACWPMASTPSTRTSRTATSMSTKRSRSRRPLISLRPSIAAAIASPPMARRCASPTSNSPAAQQSGVGAGFRHDRPAVGALIPVPGYSDGVVRDGTAFGQPASGIRPGRRLELPGRDAFVLVDATNTLRYPPRAGTDGALIGGAC